MEEKLGELNTPSVNATEVMRLIEEARSLMDEAENLVEKDPDGS